MMKKELTTSLFGIAFFLAATSVYAQKSLTVEYQYPGNEQAQREFQVAADNQTNKQTSALRTTWIAESPGANWFISLEGGVANYIAERWEEQPYSKTIRPTFGIGIGKWFTPVWGLRLGINSAKLTEHDPTAAEGAWNVGKQYRTLNDGTWTNSQYIHCGDLSNQLQSGGTLSPEQATIRERFLTQRDGGWFADFSYIATTVDFIVNIKHLFLPYNPYARFNPVIYGGLGFGHTFGSQFDPWGSVNEGQNVTAVNNVVGKAGLQLNYTISDPVSIYLNLEGMLVPEDFERYVGGARSMEGLANITVGISCNLGFKHSIKAPFYDEAEIAALNETINELRTRPESCPECPACQECPPCPVSPANTVNETDKITVLDPVFFTIDSYKIRESQFGKITQAANYLLANPEAKLILASYADEKTGNPAHNWTLSNNRSKAVANVLVSLGVASDRLILKYYGDTVQPFETNELNRATLFIKEQ